MEMNKLQALFFDFDGVILDSVHIKTKAFQMMFEEYGKEIVAKVISHHQHHGGISRVEKLATYYQDFLGQPLNEVQLKESCDQFSKIVMDQVVRSEWIPGAEAFLDKYHSSVHLYVVSGTPENELKEIIKRRKMDHYFKQVMGSPIKKPIHVTQTLKETGFAQNRCLFIGDALTDFQTAVETHLRFIGVQGDVPFPEGTMVIPDCTSLETAIQQL